MSSDRENGLRIMDSLPGASRIKGDSPKQPNKKKHKKDYTKTEYISSTTIDNVPEDILLEIFKYLSIPDKIRVRRVCKKFYQTIKNEVLWKYVVLSNMPTSLFIRILSSLPSCVSHFEWKCDSLLLPLSFIQLIAKLHERCPSLKTLVLQMVTFLHNTDNYDVFCNVKGGLGEGLNEMIQSHYKKDENIELVDVVLPELKILSLTNVFFSSCRPVQPSFRIISSSVFPNLSILDFSATGVLRESSHSINYLEPYLMGTLSNLKELYLSDSGLNIVFGCHRETDFMKSFKKLRVLDLGSTHECDDLISYVLENCIYLEELYLCDTDNKRFTRQMRRAKEFPHLQTLCLRKTNVTQSCIEEFLYKCPSLKFVNVNDCQNISETWYQSLSKVFKEKLHYVHCEKNNCDHILKREYLTR